MLERNWVAKREMSLQEFDLHMERRWKEEGVGAFWSGTVW
jgi:hypothetical protein